MENNILLDKWANYNDVKAWEENPPMLVVEDDNFFGKKARARRQAKRAARKEAKQQGLSRKEIRLAGRAAKKQVRSTQGTGIFGGLLGAKLSARQAAKAGAKLEALKSGASIKQARTAGRDAKQEVIATQKEAKAKRKLSKGKTKAAERLTKKAEKLRALDGRTRAGHALKSGVLSPLLPLRKKMEGMLKQRGFKVPVLFEDTVKLFYNEIVAAGRKGKYDAVPRINFDALPYHADESGEKSNIGGTVITVLTTIVKAIIDFFKSSKEKVDTGQPVTNVEKQAAEVITQVERKIEQQAQDEAAQRVGERILFDQNTWLIIGAVVVGIVLLARAVR